MKRTITYISTALLLIVGLCISCQKEQSSSEGNGAPVNEVIVKATISGAATKVSFTEGGTNNKLKADWDNDDKIVGWDENGNAIELEIASIDNGTAIFKTVEGSSAIPTSGKVYMIYAPGKSKTDISNKSLEYSLADQGSSKLPALMTATGTVSNNVLSLSFTNQLAILAVKNPKFPVTEATNITGLNLSGSNILTKATFSIEDGNLKMESSEEGDITRACDFTTDADGKTETMVYFAVLPNSDAADVTVSTTDPEGYQISFSRKSFAAGQCYLLDQKKIDKQTFAVTVDNTIQNGTITTTPTSGSSVAWGTEVTVTATPADGYELATLTYNDGEDHNIKDAGSFTMPQENVTVSGSFQKKDFAITADVTPASGIYTVTGGTYTIKKGSDNVTTAKMGDVITVTPSPAAGYSGGTVTVKKTGSEETVEFNVTSKTFTMPAANVTITVTFTSGYSITKATATNGSFTVKKDGTEVGSADSQDEITIEAVPAIGYVVDAIGVRDADDKAAVAVTENAKFTMPAKAVTVTVTFKLNPTNVIGNHEYVEIGNKKWATTNLGADIPQYYGNLYSWGEIVTKEDYSSSKYNASSLSGDIGPTSENDAAYKNWGSTWHMPTKEDFADLAANGVWIWTTDYKKTGVSGYIVYVAQNDEDKGKANMNETWKKWNSSTNSYGSDSAATGEYSESSVDHIFFPAAGYGRGTSRSDDGSSGYYWSSSWGSSDGAYSLSFGSSDVYPQNSYSRYYGRSVRPVSD